MQFFPKARPLLSLLLPSVALSQMLPTFDPSAIEGWYYILDRCLSELRESEIAGLVQKVTSLSGDPTPIYVHGHELVAATSGSSSSGLSLSRQACDRLPQWQQCDHSCCRHPRPVATAVTFSTRNCRTCLKELSCDPITTAKNHGSASAVVLQAQDVNTRNHLI